MGILSAGWATQIKFASDLIQCTSFSFPETPVLLSSSGAYGGSMLSTGMAIGAPYVFDYSGVNGNFSYEPSATQAITLVRWLADRNVWRAVTANTPGGTATYSYCFFTNLNFIADEGTNLNASVDVWCMRDALTTDSIGSGDSVRATALEVPAFTPVPYWTTQVSPLSSSVISWNLAISQDVVKKFFCDADASSVAPAPSYVLVGPLAIELGLSFIMLSSVSLSSLLLDFSSTDQTISFGTTTFLTLDNITTSGAQPNIADMNGFYTADMMYNINSVTLPAAP